MIGTARADLLGRHVIRRAHHHAELGQPLLADAGDPEVQDLHRTVRVHHDVQRLDVAVDDPGLVRVGEAAADLFDDAQLPPDGERRVLLDGLGQRLARDVLHDDVRPVLVIADVEDRDDVRVAQLAGRPGLALEAFTHLGRVDAVAQQLDGDQAIDGGIASDIDGAHAAPADRFHDFVLTDVHVRAPSPGGSGRQGILSQARAIGRSPKRSRYNTAVALALPTRSLGSPR
ncbi:MAG: hypothetical protein U0Q55_08565 [Vicinamibacterales bacterium]